MMLIALLLTAYIATGVLVVAFILCRLGLSWSDLVDSAVSAHHKVDPDMDLSPYSTVPFAIIAFVLFWPREIYVLLNR